MSEWMEMTWNNPMRMSLWVGWECPYQSDLSESENECPYQNEWNRWDLNELKWIERFEVKWVIWRKWARTTLWESPYGQLNECPYASDLSESENQCPYQNDQNRWEMKWIEWNEVKWVIWWVWLCEPYGNLPMVDRRCPYQSDLVEPYENVPIKMNGIDEKWMKWSE